MREVKMKEINNRMGITSLNKAEIDIFGEQIAGGNMYEYGAAVLATGSLLATMGIVIHRNAQNLPGSSVIKLLGRLFNGCARPFVAKLLEQVLLFQPEGAAHHKVYKDTLDNIMDGYGLNEALNRAQSSNPDHEF
jgi:hypothetical protein